MNGKDNIIDHRGTEREAREVEVFSGFPLLIFSVHRVSLWLVVFRGLFFVFVVVFAACNGGFQDEHIVAAE
jgi:hypothetical protein